MDERIKVGIKVYLKPVNNAARYGNKEIIEMEILKVGRKYFFVGIKGETTERSMTKFKHYESPTSYSICKRLGTVFF